MRTSAKFGLSMSTIAGLCALAWGLWAQFYPRSIPFPPREVTIPPQGVAFTMPDLAGRPLVDVTINGKGPYRFILDTGAEMTVVDPMLRDSLALKDRRGVNANLDGRSLPLVLIDDLTMGGIRLAGVTAFPMPVSRLLNVENSPVGVLSAMSFAGQLVTFDYPHKRIEIRPGALRAGELDTFEYAADRVVPMVPVHIGNRIIPVPVDTGATSGLTLPNKYLDTLPIESRRKSEKPLRTAAGEFAVTLASATVPISIGANRLPRELQFSDKRGGSETSQGNIGYGVLREFVITLDSKNHRIRIMK
jgi:predicted aspartyl protease